MNLIITNGTVIGDRLIPGGAVVIIGNKILFVGDGGMADCSQGC